MAPDLVHAPREAVQAVREANFAATLDLVFRGHPHYRQRFAELGLQREDVRSLADLRRLPVTRKADYMADPDSFRLGVPDLPDEARIVWDTMYTTGTTSGRPTPFVSTAWDFYNTLAANRAALELRGVRPDDLVANLAPMTAYPAGAFHRTIHACAAMKLPVLSPMPGRPSPRFRDGSSLDEVVALVAQRRATILWGVASYVRRVVLRAEELGADLSAVRLAFLSGEPMTEALRADIAARLQALGARDPWVTSSYGATEMQVGAVECRTGSGYHNPAPDELLFEIVDPAGEPLPDGRVGSVLLTHLNRRGTVLLRYALGDASVLTHDPCPHCGATTERLTQLPQRSDGMVKVKGMLVNPAVLLEALGSMGEYQLVVDHAAPGDPHSMDRLVLRLAPASDDPGLPARAAAEVKLAIGVTPEVELVAPGAVYDAEGAAKAKRLVDRRGA